MDRTRVLAELQVVERVRCAMRDAARLDLVTSKAGYEAAQQEARVKQADLGRAVESWNAALRRHGPDPAIFGLAGAHVVRSETAHKAAILDEKIAGQRRDEHAAAFARAEARLEGAGMVVRTARRDRDAAREEAATREAEDAFIRGRRA